MRILLVVAWVMFCATASAIGILAFWLLLGMIP